MFAVPTLDALDECLKDPSRPIGARMRASYYCKHVYFQDGTSEEDKQRIIGMLCRELRVREHGKLMRHEFGYVLGQMRDAVAVPALCSVLDDRGEEVICRHECAEALGAIGGAGGLEVLRRNADDDSNPVEVKETCSIALQFIEWRDSGDKDENNAPMACACMLSPYDNTDPAPPHPSHEQLSFEEIGAQLRDQSVPLFERYRAMFSLRNKGGSEAAKQLGRSLVEDTSSALFRHEVAFVLGQLQHVDGLDFLEESLRREGEHEFVRHESAEAIGAIEENWERSEAILNEFMNDPDLTVRESCMVALDGMDYFNLFGRDDDEKGKGEGGEEEEVKGEMKEEAKEKPSKVLTFAEAKGTTKKVVNSHFNVAS